MVQSEKKKKKRNDAGRGSAAWEPEEFVEWNEDTRRSRTNKDSLEKSLTTVLISPTRLSGHTENQDQDANSVWQQTEAGVKYLLYICQNLVNLESRRSQCWVYRVDRSHTVTDTTHISM